MTKIALYQLAEKHRALMQLGDEDELPPEVIRDTLEALEGEVEEKAVSVAHFIENLDSVAESIEGAISAMQVRASRLRSRAEAIRAYLLFNMQSCGISKIESPFFVLRVRDNPPAVAIEDEAAVPDDFKVTPPPPAARPDRRAILQALKAGTEVPGCRIERRQRLEIKP